MILGYYFPNIHWNKYADTISITNFNYLQAPNMFFLLGYKFKVDFSDLKNIGCSKIA